MGLWHGQALSTTRRIGVAGPVVALLLIHVLFKALVVQLLFRLADPLVLTWLTMRYPCH